MSLGNPWYRQSRKGGVQGRTGSNQNSEAAGNVVAPNPSDSAGQSA